MSLASYQCFPAVTGDLKCEVAIVGGGLTGLSIAFHLKSHFKKWRVLVIERSLIGHGASGRSGGIIVDHPSVLGSELDVRYLKELRRSHHLPSEWQSNRDKPHQHLLNPYRLTTEIASLCRSVGVEIYEGTTVKQIDFNDCRIAGDSFTICSEFIFVATDAASELLGPLAREIHSTVQNCIVVRVAKSASERLPWAYYSEVDEQQYVWGRKIGHNIFLYGDEEKSLSGSVASREKTTEVILDSFQRELPYFDNPQVLGTWSGLIAGIPGKNRQIIQMDSRGRCLYIGGYNGYGLAAAVRSGSVVRSIVRGIEAPVDFPVSKWSDFESNDVRISTVDGARTRRYL